MPPKCSAAFKILFHKLYEFEIVKATNAQIFFFILFSLFFFLSSNFEL